MAPSEQRHVVIAIDESDQALASLRWAEANILRTNDHVTLVTVACIDDVAALPDPALMAYEDAIVNTQDDVIMKSRQLSMESNEHFINQLLTDEQRVAKQLNCTFDGQVLTQDGSVGETIAKWVSDERHHAPVQLVVCGSRGLGAFKRTILAAVGMGSTSDYLCHHLRVPVLIHHQPSTNATINSDASR